MDYCDSHNLLKSKIHFPGYPKYYSGHLSMTMLK
jgi:hypothetical protein